MIHVLLLHSNEFLFFIEVFIQLLKPILIFHKLVLEFLVTTRKYNWLIWHLVQLRVVDVINQQSSVLTHIEINFVFKIAYRHARPILRNFALAKSQVFSRFIGVTRNNLRFKLQSAFLEIILGEQLFVLIFFIDLFESILSLLLQPFDHFILVLFVFLNDV